MKFQEVQSLFEGPFSDRLVQRTILDEIARNYGLAPGEYFNFSQINDVKLQAAGKTLVEAFVLENALHRHLSVTDMLRNITEARSKMT